MRTDKTCVALALAAVAGFTDAVGYLTLRHLFTAHMSGNSARLGVFLGQFNLQSALPMAVAVLLFICGIGIGTVLGELATRRGWRATAAPLFGLQALLLVSFMLYGATLINRHGSVADHAIRGFYMLAVLAIVSIGLQVCALQRVAGETTRTAYVSGMLTKLTQEAVNWCFWLYDGARRGRPSYLSRLGFGSRRDSAARALLFGGIWCFYIGGRSPAAISTGGGDYGRSRIRSPFSRRQQPWICIGRCTKTNSGAIPAAESNSILRSGGTGARAAFASSYQDIFSDVCGERVFCAPPRDFTILTCPDARVA